jgi:2-Cys peroxiredoxin 5
MLQLTRTRLAFAAQVRAFSGTAARFVSVGDKIPSTAVYDGSPGNEVNLAEETALGKSVIVGVPGAFSPACSASHIPGYLKQLRLFGDKGYTNLYVVAVNDPFVQKAWGSDLTRNNYSDHVKFLADPRAEFTAALDLKFDATKVFGNERSKRYALLVEDGKVTKTFVEPDNTSVDVSAADKVIAEA